MPLSRYYKSGRRKYKRFKKWSATPQTPKALALQALRKFNYIKGLVNSEMFKYDQTGNTTINNTGNVTHLSAIAQGDGDSSRTGNSVLARSLFVRFVFTQSTLATDTLYRVIFFIDTQQINDSNPTVADVLDTVSTLAPINSNTAGRFKILKNYFFHTSTARDTVKEVKMYLKLYHHIRFNGAASTDIQKGGIYMLLLTDQAVNAPAFFYNSRLSYRDN